MARPSANTDLQLMNTALKIFAEKGTTQISLREIAKAADVNLGMFHYHFKSRDEFIRRILQEKYEHFFTTLTIETHGNDALENLRKALITISQFVREQRKLVIPIIKDAFAQDPIVLEFIKNNLHRHIVVLFKLIIQAQKKGQITKLNPLTTIILLMAPNILPIIASHLILKSQLQKVFDFLTEDTLFSDKAIENRVDSILELLSPNPSVNSSLKKGKKS